MKQRARSAEDKVRRSKALLAAAEEEARARGGVRFVTLAAVTERAGLHRTGVRRYYASKEELLLALAEEGWQRWSETVAARTQGRGELGPDQVAVLLADTLAEQPVFCDLLTHVTLYLEDDVDKERARRYKTRAFAAHDALVATLTSTSTLTAAQLAALLATAVTVTGGLWQAAHPTPTLAALYEEVPEWSHAAMDFTPRLRLLLRSTALGLVATLPADGSG